MLESSKQALWDWTIRYVRSIHTDIVWFWVEEEVEGGKEPTTGK